MAEHWCVEHDTEFFKKGRMKGYAHPLGDTGRWCNEEEAEKEVDAGVEATVKLATNSSIESQVAAKEIGLAFCAGKLPMEHHLVISWAKWCEARLPK